MHQSTLSPYHPPWWLRSAHLQTIWPSFFRSRAELKLDWERLELDDGDFIDLAWCKRVDAPLVLLMHGLEGSLESHYATPLIKALYDKGFAVVFMTLRGCGRELNRLPESYHSGKTADLQAVLNKLRARGQQPVAAVGISLTANLLLKYLGETAESSGLQAAVAISPPFKLALCSKQLEKGLSRVYARYLLNKLKPSFRRKAQQVAMPATLRGIDLDQIKTMYQFDDQITAPLHGFAGADDYYAHSSCFPYLKQIATPTLIIHAADDPFMTPEVIPSPQDVSATVRLEISPYGGHVGFMTAHKPWQIAYWLDQRVPAFLAEQLWANTGSLV
ncbi:MAG: hydrolase [Proteobacteria bacterium]|nr:MAG: hydrolase [Pseudomonadota bacterium]